MPGAIRARDRRLHQGWQFRDVYRSGKSLHGALMTLVSMPRSDDHGRVAFVAGRRVGHAVRRNRAKRLLKEAFRRLPPTTRDRASWRIWIARAGCAAATLERVSAEMVRLVRREPS